MPNEDRFPHIPARDRASLGSWRRNRARWAADRISNLPEQAPANLLGYLARPDAGLSAILGSRSKPGGPYPAVVVLHGCGGISSHSAGIADRIGSWGYVALTVDSLGRRGRPAVAAA